jgi:hypothetical protein
MFMKLTYGLWFVAPALQCVIAGRMWARGLYREYVLFFVYTLFHILSFPVVFYLFSLNDKSVYRYTFVTYEFLDSLLKFAVTYELFRSAFQPYEGIRGLGSILLKWGSVILLLIAAVVAVLSNGPESDRFLHGLFVIVRSANIVHGGLAFLLLLACASLGLRWDRTALGIVLGFAFVASVNLVSYTLRVEFGEKTTDVLSIIADAAYDGAVVFWALMLWSRRAVHQFRHGIPSWDVDAWNRALLNFLRQ